MSEGYRRGPRPLLAVPSTPSIPPLMAHRRGTPRVSYTGTPTHEHDLRSHPESTQVMKVKPGAADPSPGQVQGPDLATLRTRPCPGRGHV